MTISTDEPKPAAVNDRPLPNDGTGRADFQTLSLDGLRESILRRIMRAGCILGVFGMVVGMAFVRPFNMPSAVAGMVATVLVFGATYLPARLRVFTIVYPWALATTGLSIAYFTGPRPEAFLLTAGGLFMSALVQSGLQLGVLGGMTFLVGVGVYRWSHAHIPGGDSSGWITAVNAMAAVVMPAAIAGRMVVAALGKALAHRETLLEKLIEEGREKERTLAALESTRAQLTHAQKVELIGQIAGGIAHDMNNALTSVMGEASMLDDSVEQERERIIDAASYAAKLTHQLMVFARRDTGRPRPIDLCGEIRGLLKAVRRVIPSEINLDTDIPDHPLPVTADPVQILQVLLNLAGNAKDAMSHSGTIAISVRADETDTPASAVIEVADTGAGIPAENLSRIFEPFYTTKPAGRGTGLGLANVYRLVEEMSGRISVRSTVGKGTTFSIRIPGTDEPVTAEKRTIQRTERRSGTVLVVDDDVRVRATAFTALDGVGYTVLEAASPEAARAAAEAHSGTIDLLLTDVVMPGGGATETIRMVKAHRPELRVLVMSGYNNDETLKRGIRQGAYPFVAKPFTADTLLSAVDEALETSPHTPSSEDRRRDEWATSETDE